MAVCFCAYLAPFLPFYDQSVKDVKKWLGGHLGRHLGGQKECD